MFLAFVISFVSFNAMANWSLTAGLNLSEYDDAANTNYDREMGWQFGTFYFHKLTGTGHLKTGAVLTQRKSSVSNLKFDPLYLDLPIQWQMLAANNFSFFLGPKLALNLDDDNTNVKSTFLLANFGGNIAINNISSIDFFYETNLTDFAPNTDVTAFGFAYVHKI